MLSSATLAFVALVSIFGGDASMAASVEYDGWTFEYSIFDPYHAMKPLSPQEIPPVMRLFTVNAAGGEGQILDRNHPETIMYSDFRADRDTKVIIHGYTENGLRDQYVKMKDAYLGATDVNVIIVDWRLGADGSYFQSRANTRVIGKETAAFLHALKTTAQTDFNKIHIVGHSLGSHVAGYAGEALIQDYQEMVARITGLDPAGPLFGGYGVKSNYRLDKTDAAFVDVIHTDGDFAAVGGMGLMDQLGHQDFYPNGGKDMSGCDPTVHNVIDSAFCDHILSVEYFTNTIPSPGRYATTSYAQSFFDRLINGVDYQDCKQPCPEMGEHAKPGREGAFYVKVE
ncbi:pancreatic lipase-related protein 2 [Strongylocentrotus purpuratus]|uniref:Lipase domain-containing protein n=1 Tax=Strongylocentrotus purpuratus TaxID=7668 RepID=A0A7M7RGA9_STRPU|nr:pancreatic lipase-related protein 2 [Strongylocentrotus purpuratus]|eukprot:XP_785102.2 PREDICTED: pancreatic lipase-related protein 2 [Strongylocentrotus purpuratus]